MSTAFVDALVAPGRSSEISDDAAIYDFLIGEWNAEVVDHGSDGSIARSRAEIHFAWVLEGHAIQDLWISPPRAHRTQERAGPNRYGTTLRRYDAREGVWHITWINPARGVENHLVGRKVGNDIVQEGRDGAILMRWSFREITRNSFHWFGEASNDERKTWRLCTEFIAHRVPK